MPMPRPRRTCTRWASEVAVQLYMSRLSHGTLATNRSVPFRPDSSQAIGLAFAASGARCFATTSLDRKMGAASRKRQAAGARIDEDAEPIRAHTDGRETGAPRTPLHVSVPAVKRVKRESGGGAEGAAAMRTPPVGTAATQLTAVACGTPRAYDAYADRAGAKHAQASRGTGAAAGWTACPLCVRKLQARGKGCAHLLAHPSLRAPPWLAPPAVVYWNNPCSR
jgi:hypothetical protein